MMLNGQVSKRLALLSVVLVMSVSRSESIVETGDPSQLTLQLDTGKSRFVMYEPVVVTYTLANPTDRVIESNVRMLFAAGNLKLFTKYADQRPMEFATGIIGETVGKPSVVHFKRSSMIGDVRMFFNDLTNDLSFPRTGRYEITGKLYLGNFPDPTFVEADPVQVEVIGPQGKDEGVIEALGSEANLVALLRDGPEAYCKIDGSNAKCWGNLLALREKYPDSSYMPTITFLLAGALGLKGTGSGPRHDLQAGLLEDFLKRWPDHPLAADVTTALVAALRDSGKQKEATEWVDRFEQKYPGRSSPRRLIDKSTNRK